MNSVARCLPWLLLGAAYGALAVEPAGGDAVRYLPRPYVRLQHPEWSRNAVLYQINLRQFTPQGTLRAAQAQLPRLADLGVDILWLMPIHPIGVAHRKGRLGSPYAIKDYFAVNPEYGTLADLQAFVGAAHERGMKVILDWVANHTAWDNGLARQHPEWYERDDNGAFRSTPWWDWSDIIDLDYDQPGLRAYMTRALRYWVEHAAIDGYRCDVAGYVPLDFWENARAELESIKPVFMLAEYEGRDVHARAFDASYAWSWNNTLHNIALGKADATALFGYYSENESAWPHDAYRLVYVSNHDQNAWEATQFERFGAALEPVIVLQMTGEGIPMIYNGQEAGNDKRLAFFERDPIVWRPHPIGDLYRRLIALKKRHPALRSGAAGGRMKQVVNSAPEHVFSFVRAGDGDAVFVALNFSPAPLTVSLTGGPFSGEWRDEFSGKPLTLSANATLELEAWGYGVWVQE